DRPVRRTGCRARAPRVPARASADAAPSRRCRASGGRGRPSSCASPLPRELQGGGGEEREQEVPGDPVAGRADERPRRGGLVEQEQQRERDEAARRDEYAGERERVEDPHVDGLDDAPPDVELRARAGPVGGLEDARLPEELRRERRELQLPAGMVAPVVQREILVERHLETFVGMEDDLPPRGVVLPARLLGREIPRVR